MPGSARKARASRTVWQSGVEGRVTPRRRSRDDVDEPAAVEEIDAGPGPRSDAFGEAALVDLRDRGADPRGLHLFCFLDAATGQRANPAVDEKSIESLGGSDFKILAFYASPGYIAKGDTVDLCYGVSNAKTVTIEPPAGNIWVSTNRCLQIHPTKTTKYVFTAEDVKGNKQTADLTITVK
jgi:hypothetical protein